MLYTIYVRTVENHIIQAVVFGQSELFDWISILEKSSNVLNYKVQNGDSKLTPKMFGFSNMDKWVEYNFSIEYGLSK